MTRTGHHPGHGRLHESRSRPRANPSTNAPTSGHLGACCLNASPATSAFQGETISETVAAILKGEPDWARLPAGTPAIIRSLLRRCLQKDKNKRQHDIADVRIEIDEAVSSLGLKELSIAARPKFSKWLLPLIGISLAAGAILGSLAISKLKPAAAAQRSHSVPFARCRPISNYRFRTLPPWPSLRTGPNSFMRLIKGFINDLFRAWKHPHPGDRRFRSSCASTRSFLPTASGLASRADSKILRVPVTGGNPLQSMRLHVFSRTCRFGDRTVF